MAAFQRMIRFSKFTYPINHLGFFSSISSRWMCRYEGKIRVNRDNLVRCLKEDGIEGEHAERIADYYSRFLAEKGVQAKYMELRRNDIRAEGRERHKDLMQISDVVIHDPKRLSEEFASEELRFSNRKLTGKPITAASRRVREMNAEIKLGFRVVWLFTVFGGAVVVGLLWPKKNR